MYTSQERRKPGDAQERLLAGALHCLRSKGYTATTARDVAAAADANLRSIGYHFGSTKALLLAAISLNFRDWLEPLIEASSHQALTPRDRLRAGMEAFVGALEENAPMLRAWIEAIAVAGHEEELRRTLAANQCEFRARLEQTLKGTQVADPAESAAAIIAVCDGVIVRFLLHNEVARPADVARLASAALDA